MTSSQPALPPQQKNTTPPLFWSWDALLFHDDSFGGGEDAVKVTQVSNFFKPGSKHFDHFEDALAKYASLERGTEKTTTHAYGPLYSYLFDPMRENDSVESVLEIGVYSGASVQAFSEFFTDAAVVGVDITLDKVLYGSDNPLVTYIQGDGTSKQFADELGVYFDIILDDASHVPSDQVKSLDAFAPYLKPGGVFVIEDISGNTDTQKLKHDLENVARKHGLVTPVEWYDLRMVRGQFDDIVAVFRRL